MNRRSSKICYIILLLLSLSCNKKESEVENTLELNTEPVEIQKKPPIHFGKAKISMTKSNFENAFKDNLKDIIKTMHSNSREFILYKKLDVTKNIQLKSVCATFSKGRLLYLNCKYHKAILESVQQQYGGPIFKDSLIFINTCMGDMCFKYDFETMEMFSEAYIPRL